MKKIIISAISLFAMLILTISIASVVKATSVESCNQQTEYTKSFDFNDFRVNIDLQDNDRAITVTAKTGYELVSVQLDVDNDGHTGYYTYPVVNGVKFNPNPGDEINCAKVKVVKVCDLCTNLEGVQKTIPAGYEDPDKDGVCTLIPVDVCPNIEGVQTEVPKGLIKDDSGNCVEPSEEKDLCPNIDGTQLTVPNHYFIDDQGNCSRVSNGKHKTPVKPQVLGVATSPETPEALPVGGGDMLALISSIGFGLIFIFALAIGSESTSLFSKLLNEKE